MPGIGRCNSSSNLTPVVDVGEALWYDFAIRYMLFR